MPPTLITRDLAEIKAFRAEHGDIVMKPLYGKGGEAVFRLDERRPISARSTICSPSTFREQWVVQKFLPAVKQGDKRIILVDGEFAGAVNRVPAADDLRSNMVRGGAPAATDLTARERRFAPPRPPLKARPDLRRHRRDRRLSHRDQRHLADRHPRADDLFGGPDTAALIWDGSRRSGAARPNSQDEKAMTNLLAGNACCVTLGLIRLIAAPPAAAASKALYGNPSWCGGPRTGRNAMSARRISGPTPSR